MNYAQQRAFPWQRAFWNYSIGTIEKFRFWIKSNVLFYVPENKASLVRVIHKLYAVANEVVDLNL